MEAIGKAPLSELEAEMERGKVLDAKLKEYRKLVREFKKNKDNPEALALLKERFLKMQEVRS